MMSNRSQVLFEETPPLVKAYFKCAEDPYDQVKNPQGYVNLGTAENYLIETIVLEKLHDLPLLPAKALHYDDSSGGESVKQTYTEFLQYFFNISGLKSTNIVLATGVSALIEMLAFALFDENEKVLILAPLYNSFFHDFQTRFKVKVVISHALSDSGKINFQILEQDLRKHQVRVALINNPNNPLGICHQKEDIGNLIKLFQRHQTQIIVDEIYANSVFNAQFTSFLDPCFNEFDYRENIHHIYGLAKDFGLAGLKVGFFASFNQKLILAMKRVAYFHGVSTLTQHAANYLLQDRQWCEHLFKENHDLLKKAYGKLCQGLQSLEVAQLSSHAGIFTLIDLSSHLQEATFEAEMALFQHMLRDLKVNLSPGQLFCISDPGWFRVCYARDALVTGEFLRRLRSI